MYVGVSFSESNRLRRYKPKMTKAMVKSAYRMRCTKAACIAGCAGRPVKDAEGVVVRHTMKCDTSAGQRFLSHHVTKKEKKQ